MQRPAAGPTARPATPADQPTTAPEPHAGASRGVQSLAILPQTRLNFPSRELTSAMKTEFVSPYHFALVHQGLAHDDEMLEWLERA